MANIQRLIAQFKNRVAENVGEAGQMDLGGGNKVTWGWCNNPKYPSSEHKFVSVTGPGVHESGIFNTKTGKFVN